MSRRITPKQKEQVIALRTAGYTIAVLADKVGISISSAKRILSTHSIKRGELKQAVIDRAKDELLNDATAVDNIKREAYSLILDDLAIVKQLRLAMVAATEKLDANNTAEALQVMRAVSAGAVALKSTSETARKSLGLDKEDDIGDDLPELVITVMTDQEIQDIRDKSAKLSLGLDDGLGSLLPSDENNIISEGFEPSPVSV